VWKYGVIWKWKIKEVVGMTGKSLVEMQIPTVEVENVDELVRAGGGGNEQ